ncbi:DMT family transporter [Paracoccus sp. p4-l81]|uniref:DMT family transporter n=1 Tax=Paracoccus sp. p4-l81 TaxID=3342806 RepID=UPI0035BA3B57
MNLTLFAATVLIWGTTWIAIAMQIGPVPVPVSVFYRFALAAAILIPALALTGRLPAIPRGQRRWILAQAACLFSLNFLCFYTATASIPSGLVSVIFSLATVYNAINARIFFGDRITARVLIAGVMGFAGLALMFKAELADHPMGAQALRGIALAALGTLFFSFGNMISRRNSAAGIAPLTANAWGMGMGALILAGVIAATGTPIVAPPDARYWGALIYLSVVGSIIGFTTYLMMVARMGTAKAAYATVMFPVIALILSSLFEGYRWQPLSIAGLGLALAGNLVLFARPRR